MSVAQFGQTHEDAREREAREKRDEKCLSREQREEGAREKRPALLLQRAQAKSCM